MLASSHTGDVSHIRTSAKADRAPDIFCAACWVPEYHAGPAQEGDRKAERNPAGFLSRMGCARAGPPTRRPLSETLPWTKGQSLEAKTLQLNGYAACRPYFFVRGCLDGGPVASNNRAGRRSARRIRGLPVRCCVQSGDPAPGAR